MVRALVVVGLAFLLGGCAGKSTSGGDGSGGFIEAGGKGSGESGSNSGGGTPGASGKGGSTSASGSGGFMNCSPEGAHVMIGCADCTCTQRTYVCGQDMCAGKSCGGILGNTCNLDYYCAYAAGQACGAADATATCQQRPIACDDIYSPVCGCDGKTYSSDCDAATHGTGVLSAGVCPKL